MKNAKSHPDDDGEPIRANPNNWTYDPKNNFMKRSKWNSQKKSSCNLSKRCASYPYCKKCREQNEFTEKETATLVY
jgi:hypothetical protein